ncbi:rab-like protein 3 isoform X2 [Zophobas morio]|uniref:rab-like protein 3 isoform X2 n=1 Tax=Zophobas morio TaxID=2755281 RepID=UPI003082F495
MSASNTHLVIKILVVGDSGVGKTSLVNGICHQEILHFPKTTIGCSIDVLIHTVDERSYDIELWDIAGSACYRKSRFIFYDHFDGIILVHDVTNRKSYENLDEWLKEIYAASPQNHSHFYSRNLISERIPSCRPSTRDPELGEGDRSWVPMILVGTKADLDRQKVSNSFFLGGDGIVVSGLNRDCFSENSGFMKKIRFFFDRVIEYSISNCKRRHIK